MYRKKALIIGIVGGGLGGIAGGYLGTLYGRQFGFHPYVIALFTGIFAIGFAVILANIFK